MAPLKLVNEIQCKAWYRFWRICFRPVFLKFEVNGTSFWLYQSFCTIITMTQVFKWPHSRPCMVDTIALKLVGLDL